MAKRGSTSELIDHAPRKQFGSHFFAAGDPGGSLPAFHWDSQKRHFFPVSSSIRCLLCCSSRKSCWAGNATGLVLDGVGTDLHTGGGQRAHFVQLKNPYRPCPNLRDSGSFLRAQFKEAFSVGIRIRFANFAREQPEPKALDVLRTRLSRAVRKGIRAPFHAISLSTSSSVQRSRSVPTHRYTHSHGSDAAFRRSGPPGSSCCGIRHRK